MTGYETERHLWRGGEETGNKETRKREDGLGKEINLKNIRSLILLQIFNYFILSLKC